MNRFSVTLRCLSRILACRQYNTGISTANSGRDYDIVIVGGGIIGCATARLVSLKYPDLRCALVEKESEIGM